jgi:hypothetical protein
METEIQTDYGYRWLYGFTDAVAGEQWYEIQDLLNNVVRLDIGQINHGGVGTNQQTDLNSAGTGAINLNGSTNAGTGGVVIGSGGASPTTVASIDSSGNLDLWGYEGFYTGSTLHWYWSCASASVCELHDSDSSPQANVIRAFNGAGTEIDSQGTAAVTVNNTGTAGTGGFIVYEGGSNYTVAAFTVGNTGNATAAGSISPTKHLNQTATKNYAGTCAMSTSSSCTFSVNNSYTFTPICVAGAQDATALAGSCAYSGGTVTITAAVPNSSTWGAILIGNPN